MWFFICGLEVKIIKVDDYYFIYCIWFLDRIEERINKKFYCMCIMYI